MDLKEIDEFFGWAIDGLLKELEEMNYNLKEIKNELSKIENRLKGLNDKVL